MNRKLRIGLKLFGWIFVLVWLIYGLNYANKTYNSTKCTAVNVRVIDSLQVKLIDAKKIHKAIISSKNSPIGMPIKSINTYKLEQEISKMAAVRDVQIFKTASGEINVEIKQRRPILRVFNAKGQTYYIDDAGKILPHSSGFAANTIVASGNIREPFKIKPNFDISTYADSSVGGKQSLIYKLYKFAKYVSRSRLWNAQIEQLNVQDPNNVEMVPLVGPHVVNLGDLSNFEIKLKKLKLLYQKALPTEGWNKYSYINLKYKNQIVCTKNFYYGTRQ
ncbi:MAG: cell division protein FtsQ [Tenuifilum sp.]|jgi:cell division protein FtsQ|uniref:cell division protein FtsQ/DivIB n=1 Tax=Tenuifilum sp. TaxID=2760880 RepID=UPI0024AB0F83|nr:hypothetical protein [Tenuifilum sp.]MDI3526183.1 cell division protein FtsQ [Tenuifilum sp.]